jgi:UDP-N-acetylmuramoyl-L-alanyl-D-glutamate--2,6-diaminopimelate ligase
VFTNLSRDHLDYHGDMASYGAAKASLFGVDGLRFAVINIDDAFGDQLARQLQGRLPLLGCSLQRNAALQVQRATYRSDGVDAAVKTPAGVVQLRSALLGDFNLANLLAAVAVLQQLGLTVEQIETVVPRLHPIPGRMERVPVAADIDVVIDYAHTPDALEQALRALRRHCRGALWALFGCGGDRDRGKRPLMGAAAEALADRVLLTSDNPRSEEPAAIVDEIRAGCRRAPLVELDRGAAIARAVQAAAAGDCVLIAGKGHEDYQEVGGVKRPFSDLECAAAALQRRAAA